jgi:NAD(P)-dependent dehydrogenase (short-subunit alcohol dehydrogenase family)
MQHSFENQAALVTGGGTGIGAATALLLAQAGARVVITGRQEATLQASAARHANLSYVVADVSKPAEAARALDQVRARLGRLDVLINNAAVMEMAPLADASVEHVRRTWETNVLGLIETTRLALPLLRQSRGAIVNLATVVADQPFANMSVYSASKAAVLALTRSWAQELGPEGIRVNAVSPGPIATPMFSAEKIGISAGELDRMASWIVGQVPMNRFGQPEEVAQVIAFLASPSASYVTGAQYSVGGGIEA